MGDWMITSDATSGGTTALQTTANEAVVSAVTDTGSFGILTFAQSSFFDTTPIDGEFVAELISVMNPRLKLLKD